jgi:four helix bundle protein
VPVAVPDQLIPLENQAAFQVLRCDGMSGADRFEDLISWQRMHELNIEVWKATEHGRASRDFDFRNEIRDAADLAERNVAEGFDRYKPKVFAHFLDFSRGSAAETRGLLKKGFFAGYFSEGDFKRLDALAVRGVQAVAKFQRYLRSPSAERNAAQRYSKRRGQRPKNDPNDPNDPNVSNESNESNDPKAK